MAHFEVVPEGLRNAGQKSGAMIVPNGFADAPGGTARAGRKHGAMIVPTGFVSMREPAHKLG